MEAASLLLWLTLLALLQEAVLGDHGPGQIVSCQHHCVQQAHAAQCIKPSALRPFLRHLTPCSLRRASCAWQGVLCMAGMVQKPLSCSSETIQGLSAQCISSQCKPPAISCDALPCFGLQLEDTSPRQLTQREWLWGDWPFRGSLLG